MTSHIQTLDYLKKEIDNIEDKDFASSCNLFCLCPKTLSKSKRNHFFVLRGIESVNGLSYLVLEEICESQVENKI